MHDFDEIVNQLKTGELNINDWHYCTCREKGGTCGAYIMGEGSEQCLARKHGFESEEAVKDFFESLGVNRKWIFPI